MTTTVRPMSTKTWNEIYELVGRIQQEAIESRDWQIAKGADIITMLLQNLPKKSCRPVKILPPGQ